MKAYLTIDDGPTAETDAMTKTLQEWGAPALLFFWGSTMEQNPGPVVRAIQRGFVIANHYYSHPPAGTVSYEENISQIERTEKLIDEAYKKAGVERPGKYLRFPYLDRGNGDRLERRFGEIVDAMVAGGTVDLTSPDAAAEDKKNRLQDYLKREGFCQPFRGINHPLYRHPDVAAAADCFFTYSACDWMLLPRHAGKWSYKTLPDLKKKIDEDQWLAENDSTHVILTHDKEGLLDVELALIRHLLDKGVSFQHPAA